MLDDLTSPSSLTPPTEASKEATEDEAAQQRENTSTRRGEKETGMWTNLLVFE